MSRLASHLIALVAAGTIAGAALAQEADTQPSIAVHVDNAKVMRLPAKTATVVIGNPIIADVTLQKNGVVILTGKSFGRTNLIALDSTGAMIAETTISVQAPREASTVMVQRGLARESYSCTPNCQPSVQLGDSTAFFGENSTQATERRRLAGTGAQ